MANGTQNNWELKYVVGNPKTRFKVTSDASNPQRRSDALKGAKKLAANDWRVWVENTKTGVRIFESEQEKSYKNTAKLELESLRSDLKFQLGTIDDLDWNYFLETAMKAKIVADKSELNMPSSERYISEIIGDATAAITIEAKAIDDWKNNKIDQDVNLHPVKYNFEQFKYRPKALYKEKGK